MQNGIAHIICDCLLCRHSICPFMCRNCGALSSIELICPKLTTLNLKVGIRSYNCFCFSLCYIMHRVSCAWWNMGIPDVSWMSLFIPFPSIHALFSYLYLSLPLDPWPIHPLTSHLFPCCALAPLSCQGTSVGRNVLMRAVSRCARLHTLDVQDCRNVSVVEHVLLRHRLLVTACKAFVQYIFRPIAAAISTMHAHSHYASFSGALWGFFRFSPFNTLLLSLTLILSI